MHIFLLAETKFQACFCLFSLSFIVVSISVHFYANDRQLDFLFFSYIVYNKYKFFFCFMLSQMIFFQLELITADFQPAFHRIKASQQMMLKTKKRMGKEIRKNLSIRQYSSANCCNETALVWALSCTSYLKLSLQTILMFILC